MGFQRFAARAFTEEEMGRITIDEEKVLVARRRMSPVQACAELNISPSNLYRKQKSIMEKLGP